MKTFMNGRPHSELMYRETTMISSSAKLHSESLICDDILKWETNPNVIQFFGNIPASAIKKNIHSYSKR